MKYSKTWAAAAAMVALAGAAQASLINRSGGMIYDTVENVTWLADMNYAKTSGYDSDGQMAWTAAVIWADNLVYGGYSDWRLPTIDTISLATNGELNHLFITDLGNKDRESVLTTTGDTAEQIANLALFSNVKSYFYWSGTELGATVASSFFTFEGRYGSTSKGGELYAVAVRPGDVAADVPEPQTLALALLALGAMAVARRRRPG
jgi:MYXO-CTERM domain-containing protein